MKNIEVTDKTYDMLMELKNHTTVKLRSITNEKGVSLLNPKKDDYEEGYSMDDFLVEMVDMIWYEQSTGQVAFIT